MHLLLRRLSSVCSSSSSLPRVRTHTHTLSLSFVRARSLCPPLPHLIEILPTYLINYLCVNNILTLTIEILPTYLIIYKEGRDLPYLYTVGHFLLFVC